MTQRLGELVPPNTRSINTSLEKIGIFRDRKFEVPGNSKVEKHRPESQDREA
jgi:hypothetical protein